MGSIAAAAHKARRQPEEIKLVAVSKNFQAEAITEAFTAGQLLFGENYIQELQKKRDLVPREAAFHFIGHLQSNKAKIAARLCCMVETVDSFKVARALNNHLETMNRDLDVLIQINIGEDPNKAGSTREAAKELLIQINTLPRLKICGLMTMPPFFGEPEKSRIHFRNLRILAEEFAAEKLFPGVEKPELSMGMSDDFHIAIEEGATIVRVGTAIFGHRS